MKVLNTVWLTVLAATAVVMGTVSTAMAEESAYEWEYGYQMGTRAPDAKNLTDAFRTAHDGAVYANRNAAEFATSVWNFAPSETPFRFANLHGQYSAEGGQYFTLRDFVKLPHTMANGGSVDGRQVISEDYIADVFSADADKIAAWGNGPYAPTLPGFKHYSNQWYVVDDSTAFGIGSYGAYVAFNRETGVALAKFSTYPVNPDFETAGLDLPWLIEQIGLY
ncbi:MAG: hypothetical protein AB3N22_22295 [Ruegeria sp.]